MKSTQTHSLRATVAVLLVLLMQPSLAWAWGSIGHRVIGQVADTQLSPRAAAKVSRIMGSNSLGDVANWMDQVRSTPEGQEMKPWHFESVDVCDVSSIKCENDRCASPQIEAAIAALRSGEGDQLKSLRVLVHLVGDIHQPLHAAENHGDYGGNLVTLDNRFCVNYDGTTSECKLHSYWDNSLVKLALGTRTERELVKELAAVSVSVDGNAEAWVKESNGIAKSRAHNYEGFACGIGPNHVRLASEYDRDATAVVTEQMARAGHRLAAILNDIYN